MANAVIMPKSGISVESCIIGEWKVKVGDAVKVGDIVTVWVLDVDVKRKRISLTMKTPKKQ